MQRHVPEGVLSEGLTLEGGQAGLLLISLTHTLSLSCHPLSRVSFSQPAVCVEGKTRVNMESSPEVWLQQLARSQRRLPHTSVREKRENTLS